MSFGLRVVYTSKRFGNEERTIPSTSMVVETRTCNDARRNNYKMPHLEGSDCQRRDYLEACCAATSPLTSSFRGSPDARKIPFANHRPHLHHSFILSRVGVDNQLLPSTTFTMSSLLGAGYESSDDDATAPKTSVTTATKVVAAPEVNTEVWSPILFNHTRSTLLGRFEWPDRTNDPTGPSAHANDPRQHYLQCPHLQRHLR